MSNALYENEYSNGIKKINLNVKSRRVLNDTRKILYSKNHLVANPCIIKKSFVNIFREYNQVFNRMVQKNIDSSDDYSFNKNGSDERVNWIVQIDLKGLDEEFFHTCVGRSQPEVDISVKSRIFEIENSWAAYSVHASATGPERKSAYSVKSLEMISGIRMSTNKKIILLALTDEKYLSMLDAELGLTISQQVIPEKVIEFTGFDDFWGPREFINHVENLEDIENYLFYVRSSDPVRKFKDNTVQIVHPLLSVEKYKRLIKSKSLTLNIDNSNWDSLDCRKISDSKMYMPTMGLADIIESPEEIETLQNKYMQTRVRAKPAVGSYGCYGHFSGYLNDKKFRYNLRSGLLKWGKYVIQPEYPPSLVENTGDGKQYAYMDRIFCGFISNHEEYFGGQRIYIPTDSFEVKKRRLHIVNDSILGEIY
jgi:hypothetical protein